MAGTQLDMYISEHSSSEFVLEFISFWSKWFLDHSESYDGALGRSLAYLWPAIISGEAIEVTKRHAITKLLHKHDIPASDPIWQFVRVVG